MSCAPGDHNDITTKFCPDCGEQLILDPIRIDHLDQLREVAELLGVRPDWHEPSELEVTARVRGNSFDNAGFWPHDPTGRYMCTSSLDSPGLEMYVELIQAGQVIAQVNLATLFAIACRTHT